MYRLAFKTQRGLRVGLKSLTLEDAREKKQFFNQHKNNCIIITEEYFLGKEPFKEVM